MTAPHRLAAVLIGILALAPACGGSTPVDSAAPVADSSGAATNSSGVGVRVVGIDEAAAIAANPPSDLVVLDVRTPEEFAEGHLEGATTIDFYADDFADRVAELDPTVPYLLYCQSGNRSGQAAALMADLGFADVADVDGGIAAWTGDGLAVTQ